MNQENTHFIPELATVINTLQKELRPGDVVIVLSAGDANLVTKVLAELLPERKN